MRREPNPPTSPDRVRRRALGGIAVIGTLGFVSRGHARAGSRSDTAWISSCAQLPHGFALARLPDLTTGARIIHADPVPIRGHAIAINPLRSRAIAISRRPGRTAWVMDLHESRRLARFNAPNERHFQGHAVFSADGKVLYTTENAYEARCSVIGIWDTNNWQRLDEFATHGVGAHALQWMPDQKTLAVCNGGILTHPDFPRRKLNLDTMAPSLVYLDATNGKRIDEYRPAHHQLSIRHLDVHPDGTVVLAMQRQLSNGPAQALLARHRGETSLVTATLARPMSWHAFNGYIGDVCFAPDGKWAAFTSPRGGVLGFWDIAANRVAQIEVMADVCGIGFDRSNQVFLASAGSGEVRTYRLRDSRWRPVQVQRFPGTRWDNHLSFIG